jgi:hypothetical protein
VVRSGVRSISGSDAVSDCCSGLVLHNWDDVQSTLVNGVLCMVGSPSKKLWESSLLSESGVGVRVGGLNENLR